MNIEEEKLLSKVMNESICYDPKRKTDWKTNIIIKLKEIWKKVVNFIKGF